MLVECLLNKVAFSEDFIVILTCSDFYSIQSSGRLHQNIIWLYYCIPFLIFFIHLNRLCTHFRTVVQTSPCWRRERERKGVIVSFDHLSCRWRLSTWLWWRKDQGYAVLCRAWNTFSSFISCVFYAFNSINMYLRCVMFTLNWISLL